MSSTETTTDRREDLVTENIGLAKFVAAKYRNRGISDEDLDQVACMGLVLAAERFDPQRGVKFATFAVPTIRGELQRHLRDRGWSVHVPRGLKALVLRVTNETASLGHQLGRSPTVPELAAALGESEDAVLEALAAGGAYQATSLDHPDVSVPAEERSDREQSLVLERAMVGPALEALDERDRNLLQLYYIDGLNQREIGEQLGVSQVRVSRLLARALERVRETIGAT